MSFPDFFFLFLTCRSLLERVRTGLFLLDSGALQGKKKVLWVRLGFLFLNNWAVPEMVGHLHLQAMDDSLKGKNREGLLDSPDSGLPPSPSPPFCSLSPALIESRSGSCTTPVESHHGYYKKESREGKLVRNKLLHFIVLIPPCERRADTYSCSLCPILHSDASVTQWIKGQRSSSSVMTLKEEKLKTWKSF